MADGMTFCVCPAVLTMKVLFLFGKGEDTSSEGSLSVDDEACSSASVGLSSTVVLLSVTAGLMMVLSDFEKTVNE